MSRGINNQVLPLCFKFFIVFIFLFFLLKFWNIVFVDFCMS
uniref:Uncharacterized protein n=1 Tax=Arundo donax TaxID=35708 RepID=A0A0A8Z1K3_ARUDO